MPTISQAEPVPLAIADASAARPFVMRASYEAPQLPDVFFNNVLKGAPCWQHCGGLGLRMTAAQGGVTVKISVVFHLSQPRLTFRAGIDNGSIAGWINVSGAGGIRRRARGHLRSGLLGQYQSDRRDSGRSTIGRIHR